MRHGLQAAAWVIVAAVVASACATRGFVRTETAAVDTRVDSLSTAVDEVDARVGQNADRIEEVGRQAAAAGETAAAAQNTADAASAAAREVDARVDAAEAESTAARRLILEVTLSEAQGGFEFGSAALPEATQARLDDLVRQIAADAQSVFIEIEGHTDSTGPAATNMRLGTERALSVQRYLYEEHQVPLSRMNLISYGEDRPAAANATAEGRAENRRVVIRIRS